MISLSGSDRAQAGTTYCVTASNVSGALSAKATVGGQAVPITVSYDASRHEATICFVIPKGAKGGVEVKATDGSSAEYVSFSALIARP